MVKRSDLRPTSEATRVVAAYLRDELGGVSQARIGELLGRTQAYVSVRLRGLDDFTIDDLDAIARGLLGLEDAFELAGNARASRHAEGDSAAG